MKSIHLLLPIALTSSSLFAATYTVHFDHQAKSQSDANLFVKPRDTINLQVHNTNATCYMYNFATAVGADDRLDDATPRPVVQTTYIHRYDVNQYVVDIRRRDIDSCDNDTRGDYRFTVDVETLGWALDFSGAFYISDLTSQSYFLKPGTTSDGAAGFIVHRNSSAEDSFQKSVAMLVHLYDERRALETNIQMAPLMFGIGMNESTNYLLGTSVKFGRAMYLSFGAIFGDIDVLPIELSEGGFTENANALETLGSKSDHGWFLSFSYRFGSSAANARLAGFFSGTQSPSQPDPPIAMTEAEAMEINGAQ